MTSHASRTLAAIHEDQRARRQEIEGRGLRDIITVMEWATGLREVSRYLGASGRFGGQHSHPTLAAWAKATFGTGILRKVNTGSIEGRRTTTYEVV